MITVDKIITTPQYWDKIYSGHNDNAVVDASNTQRPINAFDRFQWVTHYAEGPCILGVASGHAHIEKRIKAMNPDWFVFASDQSTEALKVAKYEHYWITSAYDLPLFRGEKFNSLICTQAMEYMEDQERFILEAKRVSEKLLITVPIGEMKKWSQLRIYTEENIRQLLEPYGIIEVFERYDDLLLVKLSFYE